MKKLYYSISWKRKPKVMAIYRYDPVPHTGKYPYGNYKARHAKFGASIRDMMGEDFNKYGRLKLKIVVWDSYYSSRRCAEYTRDYSWKKHNKKCKHQYEKHWR